jgi:DedD protein
MRDLRKFRNKLTIELDNRQIAFLFTGVLAVLAIVFALGVVVGKGLGQMQGTEMAIMASPTPDFGAPTPTQFDVPPTMPAEDPAETPTPAPGPVNLLDEPTPATPEPTPEPMPAPTPMPIPSTQATPIAKSAPTPPAAGGWTVQLSAHQSASEAAGRQNKWLAKGIKAYVVKIDLGGKGVWHRVRVGKFATKAGAQEFADAIGKKENIKPYVAPLK